MLIVTVLFQSRINQCRKLVSKVSMAVWSLLCHYEANEFGFWIRPIVCTIIAAPGKASFISWPQVGSFISHDLKTESEIVSVIVMEVELVANHHFHGSR